MMPTSAIVNPTEQSSGGAILGNPDLHFVKELDTVLESYLKQRHKRVDLQMLQPLPPILLPNYFLLSNNELCAADAPLRVKLITSISKFCKRHGDKELILSPELAQEKQGLLKISSYKTGWIPG